MQMMLDAVLGTSKAQKKEKKKKKNEVCKEFIPNQGITGMSMEGTGRFDAASDKVWAEVHEHAAVRKQKKKREKESEGVGTCKEHGEGRKTRLKYTFI